jgi:hypothetical protein
VIVTADDPDTVYISCKTLDEGVEIVKFDVLSEIAGLVPAPIVEGTHFEPSHAKACPLDGALVVVSTSLRASIEKPLKDTVLSILFDASI